MVLSRMIWVQPPSPPPPPPASVGDRAPAILLYKEKKTKRVGGGALSMSQLKGEVGRKDTNKMTARNL